MWEMFYSSIVWLNSHVFLWNVRLFQSAEKCVSGLMRRLHLWRKWITVLPLRKKTLQIHLECWLQKTGISMTELNTMRSKQKWINSSEWIFAPKICPNFRNVCELVLRGSSWNTLTVTITLLVHLREYNFFLRKSNQNLLFSMNMNSSKDERIVW